jgi:HrpA-like RNA helicase
VFVFKNESPLSKSLQTASPVIGSKSMVIIQSLFSSATFDRRRTFESEHNQLASICGSSPTQCITGKLSQIIPQVPPASMSSAAMQHGRAQLPISRHHASFMEALQKNQVLIVAGESGVGKSTQIPQYLLEHCHRLQRTCCVVSSQPSRVDALGLADRIAVERGEQLGQTIGFQIRLESK